MPNWTDDEGRSDYHPINPKKNMTTNKQDNKSKQQTTAMTKQPTQALADYGGWGLDEAEKESKEMSSGGDFWKPPVGKTAVRFLPPKKAWGVNTPFVIDYQHFIRMPGLAKPIVFSCPKQHESKRCLACEKADELEAAGNKRDYEAGRNMRPSKRVLANVVVSPKDPESNVSVWGFGTRVFQALKSIRTDEENGGDFTNPTDGFNIVVEREGTGKDDTKYTLIPGRARGPLANVDWMGNQRDLRRLVRVPTVDQQQRLFDGEDPRDVWSEDSGRGPAGKVIDIDPNKRTAEDDMFDEEVDVD